MPIMLLMKNRNFQSKTQHTIRWLQGVSLNVVADAAADAWLHKNDHRCSTKFARTEDMLMN